MSSPAVPLTNPLGRLAAALTPTMTLRARGTADPALVWERYAVPAAWPSWSPQIRHVECSDARLSPGSVGRIIGPWGVSAEFEVLDWDELGRSWSWSVQRGPVHLHLEHDVVERNGGTEAVLRTSGPLPVVLGYLPAAQLAIGRLVR
jgi:hypothetical protein